MLALEAIQIVSRFLVGAVTDDKDPNARTMLSWAGTAAGMCTALTPVSWYQILAQVVSAAAPGLSQGAALAMLAPACFNSLDSSRPGCYDLLADAMGVPPDAGTESGRQRFLTGLRHLVRSVGLENESLADYGLGPVDIPLLARNAFNAMNVLPEEAPAVPARPTIEALLAAALTPPSVGAAPGRENLVTDPLDQQRRHSHGT
jgi:alcohol dehydrogenase